MQHRSVTVATTCVDRELPIFRVPPDLRPAPRQLSTDKLGLGLDKRHHEVARALPGFGRLEPLRFEPLIQVLVLELVKHGALGLCVRSHLKFLS